MSRAEEGRLPILGTMSKGLLKTAVRTAMCHSLAPSREMDLGRAGGFDNWARGRKAQKSQWERREHTYLLCSINNLCEGKREKQKAKESMSFIRSTLGLAVFPP